jgi:hypothetical protein
MLAAGFNIDDRRPAHPKALGEFVLADFWRRALACVANFAPDFAVEFIITSLSHQPYYTIALFWMSNAANTIIWQTCLCNIRIDINPGGQFRMKARSKEDRAAAAKLPGETFCMEENAMSAEKIIDVAERVEEVVGAGDTVSVIEETIVVVEDEHGGREVEVSAELAGDPEHHRHHFHASRDAPLLEVLDEGARKLGVHLLPKSAEPLDRLHGVYEHHEIGPALDLSLTLAEFLREKPRTHHFAVELVLAIRVNTRWRVAPERDMTPRAILALADLSADEYSLYFPPDSVDPLPPDTPVALHRGQRFEAQRDGKYGEGR